MYVIRKRMKLEPEKAIYLFVNGKMCPTSALLSQIYDENKRTKMDSYILNMTVKALLDNLFYLSILYKFSMSASRAPYLSNWRYISNVFIWCQKITKNNTGLSGRYGW